MREYLISDLFCLSWEELGLHQMAKIVGLSDELSKHTKNSVQYGLLSIEILRTLRKNKGAVGELDLLQVLDCFNDIKFFRRYPDGRFINPWYFFPLKHIVIGWRARRRPEMSGQLPMYNRSFEQLCFADSAFSAFCKLNHALRNTIDPNVAAAIEKDMHEALDALICILYTEPENFDASVSEPTLRLSVDCKALILQTYANVRGFITDREIHLFPKVEQSSEAEPELTGSMWMNLRYDLAKTEVFSGFKNASRAMIYDALDFLDKEAREISEQKRKST